MKVSKKRLIEAINHLIAGYENNCIQHRIDRCPLCLIYHNDKAYGRSNECRNCINTVFLDENHSFHYGCVIRGRKFPKLDFDVFDQQILVTNGHNASFWRDMLKLINSSKITDINKLTPEFKNAIIEIASKYK